MSTASLAVRIPRARQSDVRWLTTSFLLVSIITTPLSTAEPQDRPISNSADDYQAPLAVADVERFTDLPEEGDFVAFSLKQAEVSLRERLGSSNYRSELPAVFTMGGINQVVGLVYDPSCNDVIVIGHYVATLQPLTLDDLVVAVRARFLHGEWPLVSLDPIGSPREMGDLRVRFEGGIRGTQFGADLLAADWSLKQMALGLQEPVVEGVTSYWSEALGEFLSGISSDRVEVGSRFWIYPLVQSIRVRENVAVIRGFSVSFFSEVFFATVDGNKVDDPAELQDPPAERFAESVRSRFDSVAKSNRSIGRTRGLMEVVALAQALHLLGSRPDLGYWLKHYPVRLVHTPPTLTGLVRTEPVPGYKEPCVMYGGVQLRALALRLQAGDVTALRDAVLQTRPKPTSLSWTFLVDDWIIPTTPGASTPASIGSLVSHAEFLYRLQRYDAAREMYGRAIAEVPSYAPLHNNLALICHDQGNARAALTHLNTAIELDRAFAAAYSNRGIVFTELGDHTAALADHNTSVELDPQRAQSFVDRGTSHERAGEDEAALRDFDRALALNPDIYQALFNKGITLSKSPEGLDRAIDAFTSALELRPLATDAAYGRGVAKAWLNRPTEAIDDFSVAISLNPKDGRAYKSRAIERAGLGEWKDALADYQAALQRGIGTRFDHTYFTVRLPETWVATRNPEPGVEVGFTSAQLPGTYWQVFLIPGLADMMKERDPDSIRQALQSQLLKQLPDATVAAAAVDYPEPDGTLFSIDVDWKLDGADQFLRVVYISSGENVLMLRAGHPHALKSAAALPIAGLFSTFQVLHR